MDGVELEFEEDALDAIADEGLKRKTGARGLRAIMEDLMLNVMYDIPSRDDICKCVITREAVVNKILPVLVPGEGLRKGLKKTIKKGKIKKEDDIVS
jgi:ATP-dependent Clp protease ATP-binding subunit ClpX